MEQINILLVGLEGILSFLSPCILPLLPIYLSVLANSGENEGEPNTKILVKNTMGFVLGISTTFFILGMSVYAVGNIFKSYQAILMLVGGILIVIMGLFYIGIIQSNLLNREKRYHMKVKKMNIFSAFVLGFTFSFGWTPCIGPALASVLVMASTSNSRATAMLLILMYTIGFTIPFIILSIFYGQLVKHLDKIKAHMLLIKKLGGIILIFAGMLMVVTAGKEISNHQGNMAEQVTEDTESIQNEAVDEQLKEESSSQEIPNDKIKALDFSLYDQYGQLHALSEYKGKTIFLNFWATWCPPCKEEMPYIEEIYKEYGENTEDVIILGIVNPELGREVDKAAIENFLEENNYTFPVMFDTNYSLIYKYGLSAFPSTLIIDEAGYINVYVPGAMDKATMKKIIDEAR